MALESSSRRLTPIRRRLCVGSGNGEALFLELDGVTGRIDLFSAGRTGNYPSFLAFHPSRAIAYAAHEASAEVAALALGGARIGVLNRLPSGGAGPAYVSLDRSGSFLFVANYLGGSISVIELQKDGTLGDVVHNAACGDNPHAIVVDPSNRFVVVPALGSDRIFQFWFDRKSPSLKPSGKGSIAARPGSGPRHLVFHPSRPFAYASYEHTSEIAYYQFDAELGNLSERQILSTLPGAASKPRNSAAELLIAPSGRFLYASNRGHDSIAIFAIQPDGTLTLLGHAPSDGQVPRSFAISPAGDLLVVANLESNSLATFRVDVASGVLTHLATTPSIPAPYWVGFF